jgi:hypothetical protein
MNGDGGGVRVMSRGHGVGILVCASSEQVVFDVKGLLTMMLMMMMMMMIMMMLMMMMMMMLLMLMMMMISILIT